MPNKLVVSWLVTMITAAAGAAPAAASLRMAEMSLCSFAIVDSIRFSAVPGHSLTLSVQASLLHLATLAVHICATGSGASASLSCVCGHVKYSCVVPAGRLLPVVLVVQQLCDLRGGRHAKIRAGRKPGSRFAGKQLRLDLIIPMLQCRGQGPFSV
jgi:hypothetical protein